MCKMISPKEIETKEFNRAKSGGYRPDEVDNFLDEILASYRELLEENSQLKASVSLLNEKLDSARDEQSQWKRTIMNTQKSYNEVIYSANQKADKIVYDAQDYAKKLIASAQVEAENQKKIKDKVSSEVEDFKAKILSIYQSHIKLITSLPNIEIEDQEQSSTLDVLKASTSDVADKEVSFDTIESENDFSTIIEDQKNVEKEDDSLLFDITDATGLDETRVISNKEVEETKYIPRSERFSEKQAESLDDIAAVVEQKTSSPEDKVKNLFNNNESSEKTGFFGKKKKSGFFNRKKDDDIDDYDEDDDDDE